MSDKILSPEEFAEVVAPLWSSWEKQADAVTRHDERLRRRLAEAVGLLREVIDAPVSRDPLDTDETWNRARAFLASLDSNSAGTGKDGE